MTTTTTTKWSFDHTSMCDLNLKLNYSNKLMKTKFICHLFKIIIIYIHRMFEPINVKGFGTKDLRKLSHILNEDQHVCKLRYI